MTSSPYDPYELGYTRATMVIHKKLYKKVTLSKSSTNTVFESKTVTRLCEGGIISNRKSARCGEFVLRSCTHRPSHARIEF